MDIFSAIAEPTRRSIIEMLAENGELSVTDISDKFNSSSPAISQHLKVLRDAKVVRVEKRGQQRIYSVDPKAIQEIETWVEKTKRMWEARFDRLDKLLKAEKQRKKK